MKIIVLRNETLHSNYKLIINLLYEKCFCLKNTPSFICLLIEFYLVQIYRTLVFLRYIRSENF